MDYRVRYSGRRTVSIELEKDGSVLVRAPFGFSPKRIERFLSEKEEWIRKHREKQNCRTKYPDDPEAIQELRRRAKEELIPKTYRLARQNGFQIKSVRITSARTRFGSCSADNGICLSLFLMLFPEEAREYVILHELCHTAEHNHSRRFYALLDTRMPDYRQRRELLKR